MLSRHHAFADNLHVAKLLLRVCQLFESETIRTVSGLINALDTTIQVHTDSNFKLIYDEIFLGGIQVRAEYLRISFSGIGKGGNNG